MAEHTIHIISQETERGRAQGSTVPFKGTSNYLGTSHKNPFPNSAILTHEPLEDIQTIAHIDNFKYSNFFKKREHTHIPQRERERKRERKKPTYHHYYNLQFTAKDTQLLRPQPF
jgi:hypothetical protein